MRVLTKRKKIEWFAHKYKIATMLKADMAERGISLDLREQILNSPLFWRSGKDNWSIAFDLFTYIVVKYNDESFSPVVVNYIDTREAGDTVVDRFCLAYYRREEDDRLGTEVSTETAQ